jgi:arylsulfatase A-like enzyme
MINKYNLHIFIALCLSVLILSCKREGELAEALPEAPGKNVLVVSFDAMRADGLGLYGYDREVSPNLDAFANEALVFDRAYSAAPVTPTSFAAAFTGLYPYKVFLGWHLIPVPRLADVMSQNGYQTFALLNNVQLVAERHFDQGFEVFETGPWPEEELVDMAIAQMDEAAGDGKPFFGWVHFISPHTPYTFREMSAHLAPAQSDGRFAIAVGGEFEIQSDEELQRVRDLYDGEVFYADHLFGQLIAHLRDDGLLDETIVIVTADHGEEFMDHGQVQHNALYDELVRVPLLMRHPDHPIGSRSVAPYLNIDLMPTIASMIGAEAPEEIDGIDLRSPIDPDRHRIVAAMTNRHRHEILSEQSGRKLIQTCMPEYREELYDLNSDPDERNNILLDQPELANHLAGLLEAATTSDPCAMLKAANQGKLPQDMLTPEQIEELKSLGYIQ